MRSFFCLVLFWLVNGFKPDLDREREGKDAGCLSLKSRPVIVKVILHVFKKIGPSSGKHHLKSFSTYRGTPKLLSRSDTPPPVESVNISGPFRCSTFAADKSFGGDLPFFFALDSTGGGVSAFDKSFGVPRILYTMYDVDNPMNRRQSFGFGSSMASEILHFDQQHCMNCCFLRPMLC